MLVNCKVCGHRFPDNPQKHRNRPKYCPNCLTPYKKTWQFWKPNLNWIREKLFKREERRLEKQLRTFQRIRKSLRMQYKREPTTDEVIRQWMFELGEDANKIKWEKLRHALKKES